MSKIKKISIIIPAFNEGKYIGSVLRNVLNVKIRGIMKEIIIVDDCSTDNTFKEISKFKKENYFLGKSLKILRKTKNEGKGGAIIDGLKMVSGEVVIIQDADLEYNPKDYRLLLLPILRGETNVVYGSRTLGIKRFGNKYSSIHYYIGGRLLTLTINFIYGLRLTDQPTGYKVFKKDIIPIITTKNLQRDFSYEVELTILITRAGYKIIEVPISYTPRSFSEGKKIKIRDFIKSVYIALRYKYT